MKPGQLLFWLVCSIVFAVFRWRPALAIVRGWRWIDFFHPPSLLLYPFGLNMKEPSGYDTSIGSTLCGAAVFTVLLLAIIFGSIFSLCWFHDWCYTTC